MNQERQEDYSLACAARGGSSVTIQIAWNGRSSPPTVRRSRNSASRAIRSDAASRRVTTCGIGYAQHTAEVGASGCLNGRMPMNGSSCDVSSVAERHQEDGNGALFSEHRARLFKIAYRMLGSRADAEDVLQDVYLRWHQYPTAHIQSPLAFLITIATRLCLDRLRSLRQQPVLFIDPWHPGLGGEDQLASPENQLELRDQVSMAFLSVLECLGPDERAVFLLHDVFDYEYEEVSQILAKTESSCRQIAHRARERLRAPRPRFLIAPQSRERVLQMFFSVIKTGDRRSVMALLAEEVEYETANDGEGRCAGPQAVQGCVGAASTFRFRLAGNEKADGDRTCIA